MEEDVTHLFLSCDFAAIVWRAILRWLDLVKIIPPDIFTLFDCLKGAAVIKKARSGFSLIWHATILMIWSSRNKVIFSNGVKDAVEAVKLITWRWRLSRHKIPTCLYYEWCWDPGLCLWR
jgi:hypothetical protein